jgi:CpeT/CpcT family (DUF1001)
VRGLATLALLLAAGCALARPPAGPDGMAQALLGTWDNEAQVEAAPAAWKRAPAAGDAGAWLDRQHGVFVDVAVPALTPAGGRAVFLRWRSGGPEGRVSRERVWVFKPPAAPGAPVTMAFHALKVPAALSGAGDPVTHRDALSGLTADDFVSYDAATCDLPVVGGRDGWTAAIPATCAIVARSGRRMVLSATIAVTASGLSYEEQGVLEGGGLAFKVPGAAPYAFRRRTQP